MTRASAKIAFLGLMALGSSACSVLGIRTEQEPRYTILRESEDMEVRRYEPYVIAITSAKGDPEKVQEETFRVLAAYIFGANQRKQPLPMTAPVLQGPGSEFLQRSSPILRQSIGEEWSMAFILPSKFNLTNAPKPNDPRVELHQIPAETVAVFRFSGSLDARTLPRNESRLKNWLASQVDLIPSGETRLAVYDPPLTIPFFRRTEVMIPVVVRTETKD